MQERKTQMTWIRGPKSLQKDMANRKDLNNTHKTDGRCYGGRTCLA